MKKPYSKSFSTYCHIYVDASYSPRLGKGQGGYLIFWKGGQIARSTKLFKCCNSNEAEMTAEMTAAFMAMQKAKRFCPDAQYTMYCDNITVVSLFDSRNKVTPSEKFQKNYPIYRRFKESNLPINIRTKHVKGHQRKTNGRQALMIYKADKLSKNYKNHNT